MRGFEYVAPTSVEDALRALSEYGSTAIVMAGGTDVMVSLNERAISPAHVVHLDRLEELRFIRETGGSLVIGSLATMADLAASPLVRAKAEALSVAAGRAAGPQVRNLGTIGGNLGTSSPAGDLIVALVALDASVVLESLNGTRELPVQQFLVGPKQNCMVRGELIKEIVVPAISPIGGSAFEKLGRRKAMSISIVSAAAAVTLTIDGTRFAVARVALGSVAPTVVRAVQFESALRGMPVDAVRVAELSQMVKGDICPITDGRAPGEYRQEVACVLAARCLMNAVAAAK